MRLVVRIELVAEGHLGLVEDHGKMGWLHAGGGILQQLPQHVAEAGDGADLKPVGLPRQRRQRMKGAIDIAGAVDQKDMVARLHGSGSTAWDK